MTQSKEQLYEGMYVIAANLSDEMRKKTVEKIRMGIEHAGGVIQKEHDLGKKKLAYEINRHKEGYYLLLYFTLPASQMNLLWKEWRLMEDVLRFLTLKADGVMEKIEFKTLVEQ
jgi:small subunit ribosomal protein S6